MYESLSERCMNEPKKCPTRQRLNCPQRYGIKMPRTRRRVSSSSSTSSTSSSSSSSSTASYSTVASEQATSIKDTSIITAQPNSPNTAIICFHRGVTENANGNQQTPSQPIIVRHINESSQQEQFVTVPVPAQLAEQNNASSSSLKAETNSTLPIDEQPSEANTKVAKTEVVPHIVDEKLDDNTQEEVKCAPEGIAPKNVQQSCINATATNDVQNQKAEREERIDEKKETVCLTDDTDISRADTGVATASKAKLNDEIPQQSTGSPTEIPRYSDESVEQVTEFDKNVGANINERTPIDSEACKVENDQDQVLADLKEPDARNTASESGTKSPIANVDPKNEVVSERMQKQVVGVGGEENGEKNDQQNLRKSSYEIKKGIKDDEIELVKAVQISKNESSLVVTEEIAKTDELDNLQKKETSRTVAATEGENVEATAERFVRLDEEISSKGLKNDEIAAIEGDFESMSKIIDEIKKIEHETSEIISKREEERIQEKMKMSEKDESETSKCVALKEREVNEVVGDDDAGGKEKHGDTEDAALTSNGEFQTMTTNSTESITDLAKIAADENEEIPPNIAQDKIMNKTLPVKNDDGAAVEESPSNEVTINDIVSGKTPTIVNDETRKTVREEDDRGQQNDAEHVDETTPDHTTDSENEKIIAQNEKLQMVSDNTSETITKVQQNEAVPNVSSGLVSSPQEQIPSIPSNDERKTDSELKFQKDDQADTQVTSTKHELEEIVTGEPPDTTTSNIASAPIPTDIDTSDKTGAVQNSAVDRPTEETKIQPIDSGSGISPQHDDHLPVLGSVSNVENITQSIPEPVAQMQLSTSEGVNNQKPPLPTNHQLITEDQKYAEQPARKNENVDHKQSNEIRGSEEEFISDKFQSVILNEAQKIPEVESEKLSKMSAESGKPSESSVEPGANTAIEKSGVEKIDQNNATNNSLCDSRMELASSEDDEFVDAIGEGFKEDSLESNKQQDSDKLFRGREQDSIGIQDSESQSKQLSLTSTDRINSTAIEDTDKMADRDDIPMEISFAIEDHPSDPNDGVVDQPTSQSPSEMDFSIDGQSSEGTEPKPDTVRQPIFESEKELSEDHQPQEAETELVKAIAEEPTFQAAKEPGQLTEIGGSTYETPIKKNTAAPTIDSRTITRPSKKGQALPEATIAPVVKVDNQPQTTAATQMAATTADIPTVPPAQHQQPKPQQSQSKVAPVPPQSVPVVSAVTSSSSSSAATVSAITEPQPTAPPSTAHSAQPTPKTQQAQPHQQPQQQRSQVHQQPQPQQSPIVIAPPAKTSTPINAAHGDANAATAGKASEQPKKEDQRPSHRVRQRTVTVHSQLAVDVAAAFLEIKQMGLDDPLTEAQRRIQAMIAAKEKEWAARFEKVGQVLAHEQKKTDILEQKASERLLLVGEQEMCIKKLVDQLKKISQKGAQNGMQVGRSYGGPGPERTLSPDDIAMLMKERDQLAEDVNSLETSYGELFRRYEKLRQTSIDIKNNEDRAKKQSEEMAQRYALLVEKFDMLRKNAEDQLDLANNEIDRMMKQHEDDTLTLRLRVKQLETKVESLNVNLEAKQREMDEMTNIFEEVINKAENNS